MSLFIFPIPSAASPLPHPAWQPRWVSHSFSDRLAFTCIISLASLECLSSSKSQAHCCLLRELLGVLLALSHVSISILASWLEGSTPVSWLGRTLTATAGLKPQSAHLCRSNTKYGSWHRINLQWTNSWDRTDKQNEGMCVSKIICSHVTREVTVEWLSKMPRHTKKKDLTEDPLRLNGETVVTCCWTGLGLLAGVRGLAQSLAPCSCRMWRKLSAKGILFTLKACLLIVPRLPPATLFPDLCFHTFSWDCKPVCTLGRAEGRTATPRKPGGKGQVT